jgi:hypothetical protein
MARKTTSLQPVRSLADFLTETERVVMAWAPSRDFYPWFRGHGDASWPLIPSLYRTENREFLDEDDFRDEFRRRAWPYLAGTAREPESEWEWYFLMQHHGLPTRLLDWSESALFALYFAIREAKAGTNSTVWILNPWALNRRVARKGDQILTPAERGVARYLPKANSGDTLPRAPIAIEPPLKSNRITAQKGVFTLHGRSPKALNTYPTLKSYLTKVDIDQSRTVLIKEQMLVAGVTETTVFPELTALCRELVEYWRFDNSLLKARQKIKEKNRTRARR